MRGPEENAHNFLPFEDLLANLPSKKIINPESSTLRLKPTKPLFRVASVTRRPLEGPDLLTTEASLQSWEQSQQPNSELTVGVVQIENGFWDPNPDNEGGSYTTFDESGRMSTYSLAPDGSLTVRRDIRSLMDRYTDITSSLVDGFVTEDKDDREVKVLTFVEVRKAIGYPPLKESKLFNIRLRLDDLVLDPQLLEKLNLTSKR